jgi:hypothetical protein
LLSFSLLPGSFSNSTHIVQARSVNGSDFKIVVRRYAVFGDYDPEKKLVVSLRLLSICIDTEFLRLNRCIWMIQEPF